MDKVTKDRNGNPLKILDIKPKRLWLVYDETDEGVDFKFNSDFSANDTREILEYMAKNVWR